jgi:hypothetical protein
MSALTAGLLAILVTIGSGLGQISGSGQGKAMTEAKGTFDVKLSPGVAEPGMPGTSSIRLDKQYHGDLEATGKGVMLSAGDPGQGSAGYVALERITGTLAGRTGSFALMQMATMAPGVGPQMTVTIVPGSGTGDLSGIYGGMVINTTGGKHSYVLNYAFAPK